MEYKLGELFSGPGGIALGAINTKVFKNRSANRIVHAWANDYDADSCKTYALNICPKNPESVICSDVRTLNIKKLSPIDGFAYGFPCNDFSVVGEQKGFDGEFGPLYQYGIKVLNYFEPQFFIAENVGGLQSANEGKAFRQILSDLKQAGPGYTLTPHLYKFEEYGVPQRRHRVIIVGIKKSMGRPFKVPAPTTPYKYITAREAIELPPITKNVLNQEITTQSKIVIERLKYIKPGQNIWETTLPKHLQLNVKAAKLSQIYKRIDPNKPSYTITGSGGGGTHGYHWQENRALTNRERARIQTFPDSFTFCGTKESVRKQIGMAVSPKMAQIVFASILKTLLDIPYESIPQSIKDFDGLFQFNARSKKTPCLV